MGAEMGSVDRARALHAVNSGRFGVVRRACRLEHEPFEIFVPHVGEALVVQTATQVHGEVAGLAFYVGAGPPGVGLREERGVCDPLDFASPGFFARGRGLDRTLPVRFEVLHELADPTDLPLTTEGHVVEDAGRARTVDHEHVREISDKYSHD